MLRKSGGVLSDALQKVKARMNKVPDRAKMRREYVRAILGVYANYTAALIICLCLIAGCFYGIIYLSDRQSDIQDKSILWSAVHSLIEVVGIFVCGIGLAAVWAVIVVLCSVKQDAMSIPYVPPVHEQLPILPAEEVLLRGSQALSASREELLRPASSEETPAELLLRPTNPLE